MTDPTATSALASDRAADPDQPTPAEPVDDAAAEDETEDDDTPTVGDLIHTEAQSVVRGNVIAAMALGLVPVPVIDVAAVVGISVRMVHGLSQCYDVPFSKEATRAALFALIPAALPVTAMGTTASLLKSVPGIGSVIGSGGVSLLSGAVVYALGQVFIRHYEAGGTLHDIDIQSARRQFKAALAQGRKVAARLRDTVDGVSGSGAVAGTPDGPAPSGPTTAEPPPSGEPKQSRRRTSQARATTRNGTEPG